MKYNDVGFFFIYSLMRDETRRKRDDIFRVSYRKSEVNIIVSEQSPVSVICRQEQQTPLIIEESG